jgi:hypothetical protein
MSTSSSICSLVLVPGTTTEKMVYFTTDKVLAEMLRGIALHVAPLRKIVSQNETHLSTGNKLVDRIFIPVSLGSEYAQSR